MCHFLLVQFSAFRMCIGPLCYVSDGEFDFCRGTMWLLKREVKIKVKKHGTDNSKNMQEARKRGEFELSW